MTRRIIRGALACAHAVALLACVADAGAQAAAQPASGAGSGGISIRIPDAIAGFRMIDRKDFDDPSLGTMVRYQRADSLFVDVFLYPGPDFASDCDSACARRELEREGTEFTGAFPMLVERKYVDTIAVASDSALRPAAGAAWRIGRHLRFVQQRHGVAEWSDFYLWYVPGFRVKLRASYVRDTALASAVARFATETVPAFVSGTTRGPREATAQASDEPRHMMVSVNIAGAMPAVFTTMARLLAERGFTIEDSSSAEGRLVTAPSFAWPKGSEKESWHGAESPGVRLRVSLSPAGDSTKVEMSGQSPTRAEWKDPKVSQMLELLSVMGLAGGLSGPDDKKKR